MQRPISPFAPHLRPLAERLAAGELSLIGIGPQCATAAIIEALGLRLRAYPFDWLFSSLPMVEHCLRDDFAAFLDPAQHEPVPPAARRTPTTNRAHHRLYRDRFGLQHVFNHHEMPQSLEHFERAVRKFRAAPRRHLLHIVRGRAPDLVDEVRAVAQAAAGAEVMAVCVLPVGGAAVGMRPVAAGERWSVHDLAARAPLRTLGFGSPEDEATFADFLLQRFGLAPTARAAAQMT